MRNLLFLLLISFVLPSQAYGQVDGSEWRLEVSDEAGQPIPAASVYINDSIYGLTDEEGALNIALGTDDPFILRIVAEGYSEAESRFDEQPYDLAIGITLEKKGVLGDVVIIGSRRRQATELSPISIDVLKPYLITERAQSDIKGTIEQSSGVHISDGQVNIRSGSGWSYGAGTRVLVLMDEMPIISPDAGQAQWGMIPTEATRSVEVLKGAASSLYGTSAVNGIVNVQTLDPTYTPTTDIRMYQGFYDSPQRSELKWWDGIRGWTGTQFSHTRRSGEEKQYGWVVAGMAEHNAGYQYDVPDHQGRLFGKFTYIDPRAPEWSYSISATGSWSETGDALLWNGLNQAYIPLDSQATRTIGFDFFVDPEVKYSGTYGNHTLRGRFLVIDNNASSEETNYANASQLGFAEYFWEPRIPWVDVIAGVSGQYGVSNSEIFGGVHRLDDQAVYLQVEKEIPYVKISGGIRYESLSLDNTRWSRPVLRIGANGGTDYLRIRASYGEGFRFPSMAEMFTRTNVGALQVYPNLGLQPESGWSSELGARGLFRSGRLKGYVDVAGFLMHFDNMMEFSFGRWGSGGATLFDDFGFRSINVGSTRVSGLELSTAMEYQIASATSLRLMGGITYMDPKPLEPDHVYATHPGLLPTSPEVELSYNSTSSNPGSGVLKYRYQHLGKLDAQLETNRFMVGFSLRYNDFMQNIDGIFIDPLFSQFIPDVEAARERNQNGDWIMDARVRYQATQDVSVSFVVNNLFNREYYPRPALIGPMRSFVLQLRYKLTE